MHMEVFPLKNEQLRYLLTIPILHLPFVGSCYWEHELSHTSGQCLSVKWVLRVDVEVLRVCTDLSIVIALRPEGLRGQDLGHNK